MTEIKLGPRDFISSDLHIGGCPYPYSLWLKQTPEPHRARAWEEVVARKWDYQVSTSSTIVILGDAMNMLKGPKVEQCLNWYSQRPGKKVLVPGNHDVVHRMNEKHQEDQNLRDWSEVFEILDDWSELVLPSGRYPMCHFPATMNYWAEWKNPHMPEQTQFHGHTHSNKKTSRTKQGRLLINVAWTAWRELAPIPALEELITLED